MATVTLYTRYRPARIGFCVRQDDLSAVITATDLAHAIWGGRFCPIIPCDDTEHAARLIKAFAVDTLYPVTKDDMTSKVISSHKALAWPTMEPGFYLDDGREKEPQFLSVLHPIRILRERRLNRVRFPDVVGMQWEEDDTLAPWLCALIGRYPATGSPTTFQAEFDTLEPERLVLHRDQELPADLMEQITPNTLTALDFQISPHREKAIYVASGDTFYDVVSFWNLRATGKKCAFYHHEVGSRLERVLSAFESRDDQTDTKDRPSLRLFGKNKSALNGSRFAGQSLSSPDIGILNINFKSPRFGSRSRSVLASFDPGPPPAIDFALPKKPCLEKIEFYRQHLVLEITTYRNVIWQSDYMFPPPPIPALNEFYGRQLWYYSDAVRSMPQGIALFVRTTDENCGVRGIENYALIQQLFRLARLEVQRSRPGLVARQLIQQMGGVQACRVFKIPGVRALIEKYGPTESFVRSEAIQMIRNLDFTPHQSLYIEKRDHSALTPEDVLAFLLEKEVFRAGLQLECPNCQLPFWKHIDDCISRLPCDYCGKVFNITPQLRHRGDWRFRRSGLFGASNHQEGSIPVVLTLQQIETSIHDWGMIYTTALKLDGDGIDCESDFLILQSRPDGKVDIMLGECKTNDIISQGDVDNLSAVAQKLSAVGLQVFLLFSKTGSFSEEEIVRCKGIRHSESSGGTILLSARELEPYLMYERASKEFRVDGYGGSFDNMVEATRRIYFEPTL